MADDEKALEKKGYRDTKFLAQLWNLTERRIQQLETSKIIQVVRVKGKNWYPLIDSWKQYTYYLQDIIKNKKRTDEDLEKEKLEAEIRFKQSKADAAQLDLMVLKAELLRADDVREYIEDLCANIKSMLSALPGRLAVDLTNVTNANECSQIIDSAINEVLTDLSNYKFSRKYYQERVSEKYSRSIANDGDE